MQNALKGVNHLLRGEDEFRSDLDACFKIWKRRKSFLVLGVLYFISTMLLI